MSFDVWIFLILCDFCVCSMFSVFFRLFFFFRYFDFCDFWILRFFGIVFEILDYSIF